MGDDTVDLEYLPVAVRGIAVPIHQALDHDPTSELLAPSDWMFCFDTETDTVVHGQAQQVVVIPYQVYEGQTLRFKGFGYDPITNFPGELALLCAFSREKMLAEPLPIDDFRRLFYKIAFDFRATTVGFNLAFDLPRLAHDHADARGRFNGGFTVHLEPEPWYPPIRMKKLNARAYKFEFTAPRRKRLKSKTAAKSPRKLWRGAFVDLKPAGDALLGGRYDLENLAKALELPVRKMRRPTFSRPFDRYFLKYAYRDVELTSACYFALARRFDALDLPKTLDKIFSEASVAKGEYMRIGVQPWLDVQNQDELSRLML